MMGETRSVHSHRQRPLKLKKKETELCTTNSIKKVGLILIKHLKPGQRGFTFTSSFISSTFGFSGNAL